MNNIYAYTPRALTLDYYYNGFPHLILIPRTVETTKNRHMFENEFMKPKAFGIRNIKYSGIRNVEKIELKFNGDPFWKFENTEGVDSVEDDRFTGLNIIPRVTMVFCCIDVILTRKNGTNDPVTITWEDVELAGNDQLRKVLFDMGPMFLDIGHNLIQFSDGCAGWKFFGTPPKQPHWKRTLEEYTDEELKQLTENRDDFTDWGIWATTRQKIDDILKSGTCIESKRTVYTDKILNISVAFRNKRDDDIVEISKLPELVGLYRSLKVQSGLCRINGGFYMEDRKNLKIVADNANAYRIKEIISELYPDASIHLSETVNEKETTRVRLEHVKQQMNAIMKFFAAMDDPTPPKEHYATDMTHASYNAGMFRDYPDWEMDTVENIKARLEGQLMIERSGQLAEESRAEAVRKAKESGITMYSNGKKVF